MLAYDVATIYGWFDHVIPIALNNNYHIRSCQEVSIGKFNTVWHENFMVVKFYDLPLNRLDENLLEF